MVRGKKQLRVVNVKSERKLRKEVCRGVMRAAQLSTKDSKKRPVPCRSCGAGVVCDYRLCLACGGSNLKHRLIRKHRKAKKNFERVLVELKHKQLEN